MTAVTSEPWGTVRGVPVTLFRLREGGLEAEILNYGGRIRSLTVPGKNGPVNVVLGYPSAEQYASDETCLGAMIGPVADRVRNAGFEMSGKHIRLVPNDGAHLLHSGKGFHQSFWDAETIPDGLVLSLGDATGQFGFPGHLSCRIFITLSAGTLQLKYEAQGAEDAVFSPTNHTYFNLNGCGDVRGHRLRLFGSRVMEQDADSCCTGRLLGTAGTPLDFSSPSLLSKALDDPAFVSRPAGGIDDWFETDGNGLRTAAVLSSEQTGICLTCLTDAPGVLVYTGNGLDDLPVCGGLAPRFGAVCLECQSVPNAVNLPDCFSSVSVPAGTAASMTTQFRFSLLPDVRQSL